MPRQESNNDKPSAGERLQAQKASETIATLATLFDDALLMDVFGPDAAAHVNIGILASKESQHVPPIACRAGDLFALLHKPLDVSKSKLPLFLPATLHAHHDTRFRRNAANVGRIDFVVLDYDKGDAPANVLINRAGEVPAGRIVSCLPHAIRRLGGNVHHAVRPTRQGYLRSDRRSRDGKAGGARVQSGRSRDDHHR